VAEEYDVTADACRDDVTAFLDELAGKNLIEPAS
jgi:hypothetical protein